MRAWIIVSLFFVAVLCQPPNTCRSDDDCLDCACNLETGVCDGVAGP